MYIIDNSYLCEPLRVREAMLVIARLGLQQFCLERIYFLLHLYTLHNCSFHVPYVMTIGD